uniref:Protein kinase domain-containing protein n=1 Tax=Acrobeloides nanus TaxID=290746 RepID=A0A914CA86_9BILA
MCWLPIEALADRIFSEKSDVWSFGILTYEIFIRGKVPYEKIDHNQMYEFVKNGQRLDCPEDAPNQIYAIVMSCWEKEPDDRPSFGDLVNRLYEMREYASDLYTYGYVGYRQEDNHRDDVSFRGSFLNKFENFDSE